MLAQAMNSPCRIHLSVNDFEFLTERYKLWMPRLDATTPESFDRCSREKTVDYKMFVKIMKRQVVTRRRACS
eukprot:425690-Hanusia_phi.AAC.1